MRKSFVLLAALSQILLVEGANITKTTFSNDCVLLHDVDKSEGRPHMRDIQRPFLNCSHLGKTTFNLQAFDGTDDIQSLSLSFNELNTFSLQQIVDFTTLRRIDLGHNQIIRIYPPSNKSLVFAKVTSLILRSNRLKQVPNDALAKFPRLNMLDLRRNNITTIAQTDFSGLENLVMLLIGHNRLTTIAPNALHQFQSKLFGLSISFSEIRTIPTFLSNMTSLIYLSLPGNNISELRNNIFQASKTLRYLDLARNKISRIERHAFRGLENLRNIDLTDNQIETLPRGVFDILNEEEHLTIELHQNPINCDCGMSWFKTWIDSLLYPDIRFTCEQPARNHGKQFNDLTYRNLTCSAADVTWKDDCSHVQKPKEEPVYDSLMEKCPVNCVCFNSSGIQYYPKTPASTPMKRRLWYIPIKYPYVDCSGAGYSYLPSYIREDVQALNMMDNKLRVLSISDLRRFTKLQYLYVESNGLTKVKENRTVKLPAMKELSLQHNNITKFGFVHMGSFPNLTKLRMSNNKIAAFDNNMFNSVRTVTRLYLGPNPATNFKDSMIRDLDLYSLTLRNLSLKIFPELKFYNLAYLDLSDNYIRRIPNNSFANTPFLYKAALENNKISTIEAGAFNNSNKLRVVDLSENLIERLPKGVFDPLNKDRLNVELWINPIICDCGMKWLKRWIENMEMEDPMTTIKFQCRSPINVYGKKSDEMSPDEFVCNPGSRIFPMALGQDEVIDEYFVFRHGRCHSDGNMAVAVLLTMLFTTSFILCMKWCCNRRRRNKYGRADNDMAPLEME